MTLTDYPTSTAATAHRARRRLVRPTRPLLGSPPPAGHGPAGSSWSSPPRPSPSPSPAPSPAPAGRPRARPPRRSATSCAATSPQLGAEAADRRLPPGHARSPRTPPGSAALVAGLQGSAGTDHGRRPARRARRQPGSSAPTDGPPSSPSASRPPTDADLPESAGKLMATVDGHRPARRAPRPTPPASGPCGTTSTPLNEQALHQAELLSGLPTVILLFVAFGSAIAAGIPLLLAVAGHRRRLRRAPPRHRGDPAVGVVDELLDDDRPRRRHRLQPLHRLPLPRGARGRQGRRSTPSPARSPPPAKPCSCPPSPSCCRWPPIFLVPVMVFRSMALGMILSVVATAAASLTLLPAVLVALGDRVLRAPRATSDPDRAAEGRWARWTGRGHAPARRRRSPPASACSCLLAAPALGMRLGMPGAGVVDRGRAEPRRLRRRRRAPSATAPPPRCSSPSPPTQAEHRRRAGRRRPRRRRRPASSPSRPPRVAPSCGSPRRPTVDAAGHLRPRRPPPRRASTTPSPTPPLGGPGRPEPRPHRGAHRHAPRSPSGPIMLVAFVLLLVVFRSPLIAVTSILFNLVGVAASFGFATLVFQHGHGASLLGHRAPGLRRRLGAAVLLRPALRPLDGLPAVPARRHQGAPRRHRRRPPRRPGGHRPHRPARSPTPPSS